MLKVIQHRLDMYMEREMAIEHMVQVIRSLYANQVAKVRTEQNTVIRRAFRLGKVSDKGVHSPRIYSACTVSTP